MGAIFVVNSYRIVETIKSNYVFQAVSALFEALLGLFFPNLCLSCNGGLAYGQDMLCLSCIYKLPRTDHHECLENEFTQRFWGRVPIYRGAAMYYYGRSGEVQRLIHALKYKQKPQIGFKIGQLMGAELAASPDYQTVDLIIPVPLHPRKKHQRGYNQSDYFAKGLASSMQIPWKADCLYRSKFTPTQTTKRRIDRFRNVEDVFDIRDPNKIEGKHILLVDDVLTTGATLEACALKLLKVQNVQLSMATIAMARQ